MIKKYRVKTEEELIREFGGNWKYVCSWNTSGMRYLFGKKIEKYIIVSVCGKNYLKIYDSNTTNSWYLSYNVIKELIPLYNEKIKLVYD